MTAAPSPPFVCCVLFGLQHRKGFYCKQHLFVSTEDSCIYTPTHKHKVCSCAHCTDTHTHLETTIPHIKSNTSLSLGYVYPVLLNAANVHRRGFTARHGEMTINKDSDAKPTPPVWPWKQQICMQNDGWSPTVAQRLLIPSVKEPDAENRAWDG